MEAGGGRMMAWKPKDAVEEAEGAKPNGHDRSYVIGLLSGANWLDRDIPEPDFMLGELLSTTTRMEIIGPTGLGKTNVMLAMAMKIAVAADFLHWCGGGRPRHVLFIDGEMSDRQAKKRLVDATRRNGGMPATFFYLNRYDFPDMPPLNTEAGQQVIDAMIETLGGVDLVIFDNIQALLTGDMKDEMPWQDTLPWVRSLTRRSIGQIWVHHTGHNETHGYGTKTREWQLDAVALMERVERPEADIAFKLEFTKARERSPENRADFEPAVIALANDTWTSERGDHVRTKPRTVDRVFDLLQNAIAFDGSIPPADRHIPPNTRCVNEKLWRGYCEKGCISAGSPDAFRMAFNRAATKLVDGGRVGKWNGSCWIVR
jgi:AAA domain